jgi:sugar lactone lactonase YvrE
VAFAPGHGIYATDTLSGIIARVFEKTPGQWQTDVVARDLLGVNGIAYEPGSHKLYVSNSLSRKVSAYLVADDGTLGTAVVFWTAKSGFLDGLAVDERGQVYSTLIRPLWHGRRPGKCCLFWFS